MRWKRWTASPISAAFWTTRGNGCRCQNPHRLSTNSLQSAVEHLVIQRNRQYHQNKALQHHRVANTPLRNRDLENRGHHVP
ncbi:hypothetical protein DPMN_105216 [Dreissena polymorpha]|uniref:Uncharacterized protein n=1 Tax=Dreissena polymorpha TaxID=45954 RepID=A0A9D4HDF5_DREPO|nr:hypothetical protein DPMN_105216 [Dreissena polymorpha]